MEGAGIKRNFLTQQQNVRIKLGEKVTQKELERIFDKLSPEIQSLWDKRLSNSLAHRDDVKPFYNVSDAYEYLRGIGINPENIVISNSEIIVEKEEKEEPAEEESAEEESAEEESAEEESAEEESAEEESEKAMTEEEEEIIEELDETIVVPVHLNTDGIMNEQQLAQHIAKHVNVNADLDFLNQQAQEVLKLKVEKRKTKANKLVIMGHVLASNGNQLTLQDKVEITADLLALKDMTPDERQEKIKQIGQKILDKRAGKFTGRLRSHSERMERLKALDKPASHKRDPSTMGELFNIPTKTTVPRQRKKGGASTNKAPCQNVVQDKIPRSAWITFVKQVQAELGISYKEAMKEASIRKRQGGMVVGGPQIIPPWVKEGITHKDWLRLQKLTEPQYKIDEDGTLISKKE